MEQNTRQLIADLAARYETAAFLPADPSSFMHSVEGDANKEATAFLASCLSYGSRKQFFPKIQFIIDAAQGDVDRWVRSGEWRKDIPDTAKCYYRLYKFGDMHRLIAAYESMLREYGSMKEYVRSHGSPVDLGLWADIIDRRTLIMPLDTHVVQEALRLGLLKSRTASMATARRLTDAMLEVFPDDPLRGDFALFGLGVDEETK